MSENDGLSVFVCGMWQFDRGEGFLQDKNFFVGYGDIYGII